MSTPQPQPATERPTWNLDSPDLYLNRELTWLAFNRRVLNEAEDERTPLLERLKFIAIVSANLDEFFMKRVGGLKQQRGAGVSSLTVDGRTPEQQIAEANRFVRELEARVTTTLDAVLAKLEAHDIRIVDYESLPQGDRTYLREHFFDNIFPLMTPQAIDPAHPFPFVSNLSLNLLVTVRLPGELGRISLARIKVPVGGDVPRFLKLHDVNHFVPLEQVVIHNMDMLLPGVEVLSCEMFRVTRNANTERAEEQEDDLLVMIESELRDRRFAPIVRLQVQTGIDPIHRGMLAAELALDENQDVFDCPDRALLAPRDLFQIAFLPISELHDPPHQPIDHPELVDQQRNIFHIIRDRGPLLLQHPYES